jgi:hypothetical protein
VGRQNRLASIGGRMGQLVGMQKRSVVGQAVKRADMKVR